MSALETHLAQIGGDRVQVTSSPEEVPQDETKPCPLYDVIVEGVLVYSMRTPVAGENGPILFETEQGWGKPVPEHLVRLTKAVQVALAIKEDTPATPTICNDINTSS